MPSTPGVPKESDQWTGTPAATLIPPRLEDWLRDILGVEMGEHTWMGEIWASFSFVHSLEVKHLVFLGVHHAKALTQRVKKTRFYPLQL